MTEEIKNINDFIKSSFKLQELIEQQNKTSMSSYHKSLAFRGQSNKNYKLIPSIGRGRQFSCDRSILDQERNLIEMAKYKLPHIFRADLSPIDLLSLLQHYGIPTRLLDVTMNPLVALYFASLDDSEDGEVFVFEYNDSDITNYPIVNAIAESYKFAFATTNLLSCFYKNVVEQPYFSEQKNIFDAEGGGRWVKECCNNLFFVHASEQIERQKLQQGFYILFPNDISGSKDDKWYFNKVITPIDKNNKQIVGKLIIKKDGKLDILRKLEFLGISEATLFADNVDIICKNIVGQCKR